MSQIKINTQFFYGACLIIPTGLFFLFNSASAAEIPLYTSTTPSVYTGWVAKTSDADNVVISSVTLPSANNIKLELSADVLNTLHIVFEQTEITPHFGGSDPQAFFFIDGQYANDSGADWQGAMFDTRDGLGRIISSSARDDHPDPIHLHGPVNAHAVYRPGDDLNGLDGLWNPANHPFGEVMPVQYPDFGGQIGLGVRSVTLCGNAGHTVPSGMTADFKRQRLHIKNPSQDISDDGMTEAQKKALEAAKEKGVAGYRNVSFDYYFTPNPDTCR